MYFKSSVHACALLLSALKTTKQTKQSNLSLSRTVCFFPIPSPFSLHPYSLSSPVSWQYLTIYCYSGIAFPPSLCPGSDFQFQLIENSSLYNWSTGSYLCQILMQFPHYFLLTAGFAVVHEMRYEVEKIRYSTMPFFIRKWLRRNTPSYFKSSTPFPPPFPFPF